jgi:hypothetical protein
MNKPEVQLRYNLPSWNKLELAYGARVLLMGLTCKGNHCVSCIGHGVKYEQNMWCKMIRRLDDELR